MRSLVYCRVLRNHGFRVSYLRLSTRGTVGVHGVQDMVELKVWVAEGKGFDY